MRDVPEPVVIALRERAARHGQSMQQEISQVNFGFNALAEFASICAPWLVTMFAVGGLVMLPAVSQAATGSTIVDGWGGFLQIGGSEIFTGQTPDGEAGITLLGIIGFSWGPTTSRTPA